MHHPHRHTMSQNAPWHEQGFLVVHMNQQGWQWLHGRDASISSAAALVAGMPLKDGRHRRCCGSPVCVCCSTHGVQQRVCIIHLILYANLSPCKPISMHPQTTHTLPCSHTTACRCTPALPRSSPPPHTNWQSAPTQLPWKVHAPGPSAACTTTGPAQTCHLWRRQ